MQVITPQALKEPTNPESATPKDNASKKHSFPVSMSKQADEDCYKWDDLKTVYLETIETISSQVALIEELQKQYAANRELVVEDLNDSFKGLKLSFRDLVKDAMTIAIEHATETTEIATADHGLTEVPVKFRTGVLDPDDEDAEYTYVNIATRYLNTQETVTNLITTGWVDLFATLRIETTELAETVSDATTAMNSDVLGDKQHD